MRCGGGTSGAVARANARDARPDAVGADQRDAALVQNLRAALAEHADAFDVRGEIFNVDAEMDFDVELLLRHIGERKLQIAAMHRPVGRAVAAFHVVAERNAHDLAARAAGHDANSFRRDDGCFKTLAQAERDQHAAGVG